MDSEAKPPARPLVSSNAQIAASNRALAEALLNWAMLLRLAIDTSAPTALDPSRPLLEREAWATVGMVEKSLRDSCGLLKGEKP